MHRGYFAAIVTHIVILLVYFLLSMMSYLIVGAYAYHLPVCVVLRFPWNLVVWCA